MEEVWDAIREVISSSFVSGVENKAPMKDMNPLAVGWKGTFEEVLKMLLLSFWGVEYGGLWGDWWQVFPFKRVDIAIDVSCSQRTLCLPLALIRGWGMFSH